MIMRPAVGQGIPQLFVFGLHENSVAVNLWVWMTFG